MLVFGLCVNSDMPEINCSNAPVEMYSTLEAALAAFNTNSHEHIEVRRNVTANTILWASLDSDWLTAVYLKVWELDDPKMKVWQLNEDNTLEQVA